MVFLGLQMERAAHPPAGKPLQPALKCLRLLNVLRRFAPSCDQQQALVARAPVALLDPFLEGTFLRQQVMVIPPPRPAPT